MRNLPGRTWHGTSIAINGPAVRFIRQLMGLSCMQLAEEIGKTPGYLRKIETGQHRTVSPELFKKLCQRLCIEDKRVLLAQPWTEDDETVALLDQSTQDEAVRAGVAD